MTEGRCVGAQSVVWQSANRRTESLGAVLLHFTNVFGSEQGNLLRDKELHPSLL